MHAKRIEDHLKATEAHVLAVIRIMAIRGETLFTNEQLERTYADLFKVGIYGLRPQTDSGVRSRRADLEKLGLVEWSGAKGQISTGGLAKLWQLKQPIHA